jgi:hypothetical protein
MSAGLFGLLDDVAAFARLAAASVDPGTAAFWPASIAAISFGSSRPFLFVS